MVDLEQYDIALAKHHDTRDTITTPFCLGISTSYLDEEKNIYVDCTKLSVIAKASRWRAEDWDFKTS
jgi:hypothetical protein